MRLSTLHKRLSAMVVTVLLLLPSVLHATTYTFSKQVSSFPLSNGKIRYVVQLPDDATHVHVNQNLPSGFHCEQNSDNINGLLCFPGNHQNMVIFDVDEGTVPDFIMGLFDQQTNAQITLENDEQEQATVMIHLALGIMTQFLAQNQQNNIQAPPVVAGVNVQELSRSLMEQLNSRRAMRPLLAAGGGAGGVGGAAHQVVCNGGPQYQLVLSPQIALNVDGDGDDKHEPQKNFEKFMKFTKGKMSWYKPFFESLSHPCKNFPQFLGSLTFLIVPASYLIALIVPDSLLQPTDGEITVSSGELFAKFREVTSNFTRNPGRDEHINLNGSLVTTYYNHDENLSESSAKTIIWVTELVKLGALFVLLKFPHVILGPIQGVYVGIFHMVQGGYRRLGH